MVMNSLKAEIFINAWLSGDEFSSVNDYLNVVKSVSPDELNDIARRYIRKEKMIEVVAGQV